MQTSKGQSEASYQTLVLGLRDLQLAGAMLLMEKLFQLFYCGGSVQAVQMSPSLQRFDRQLHFDQVKRM
jgi:hypothetical protein